jgi:tRNA nucleotidyltransferase/poly(A) polymerase
VLGKESKDIDIVLDNMKGEEFVSLLKEHSGKEGNKISGFGVTKFNPELSKHL